MQQNQVKALKLEKPGNTVKYLQLENMKAIIRKLGRAGDLRMGKTLGTKQTCLRDQKSQKSENRQTAVYRSRTRALLHNGRRAWHGAHL